MITSVEIDDDLFEKAFAMSSARTKKALFEELLRTYVRLHEQAGVQQLRGRLLWKGELEELREERLANAR
jgi:Arc/MetJ family transcription regulator